MGAYRSKHPKSNLWLTLAVNDRVDRVRVVLERRSASPSAKLVPPLRVELDTNSGRGGYCGDNLGSAVRYIACMYRVSV
jgi:hypothetical protein